MLIINNRTLAPQLANIRAAFGDCQSALSGRRVAAAVPRISPVSTIKTST